MSGNDEAVARPTGLDPDVAVAFHDSAAVNQALRAMLQFADQTSRLTAHADMPPT